MFLTSGELVRLMTEGIVLRDSKNMADSSSRPRVQFFQGHSAWLKKTNFVPQVLIEFCKVKKCISETIFAFFNTASLVRYDLLTFVLSLQKIPRSFVAAYSIQFFTHLEQKDRNDGRVSPLISLIILRSIAPGGYRLLTSCSITCLLDCVPCDTSCCSVSLYLYLQESPLRYWELFWLNLFIGTWPPVHNNVALDH